MKTIGKTLKSCLYMLFVIAFFMLFSVIGRGSEIEAVTIQIDKSNNFQSGQYNICYNNGSSCTGWTEYVDSESLGWGRNYLEGIKLVTNSSGFTAQYRHKNRDYYEGSAFYSVYNSSYLNKYVVLHLRSLNRNDSVQDTTSYTFEYYYFNKNDRATAGSDSSWTKGPQSRDVVLAVPNPQTLYYKYTTSSSNSGTSGCSTASWGAKGSYPYVATLTSPSNVTGQYYLYVYITYKRDSASGTYSNTFQSTNLDNTGPEITITPVGTSSAYSNATSASVKVEDKHVGTVSKMTYNWNGSATSSSTAFTGSSISTPVVESKKTLCVWAKDSLGNESTACADNYIDRIAPSITIDGSYQFSNSSGTAKWSNGSAVGVSITDGIGVASKSYSWTTAGGSGTPDATVVTPSVCAGDTLNISASDTAGNSSSASKFLYVDKCSPSISIDTESEFANWNWNNDSTVSVSVSDTGSGLSSLYYKFGTSTCSASNGTAVTVNETSYSITVPSGIAASANLCVYAVDALSQTNTQYKALYIDNVAPSITIDSAGTFSSWSNATTVGVSITDGGSGVGSIYYKWGATSCSASNGTALTVVSGGGYTLNVPSNTPAGTNLCIYAVDNAVAGDNVANSTSTYKFLYIDNVAPSITIDTGSQFTSWSNDTTVGVSVTDGGSGVGSIYYKWGATSCSASNGTALAVVSGGSYTLNVPSNTPAGTNLCIYAADALSNGDVKYKFLYADNVAPSITIDTSGQFTSWNNDTTVGVSVTDEGSDVGSIYYKWGATSCSASNGTALTVVSGGSYTLNVPSSTPNGKYLCIYSKDVAGNDRSTYKSLNIDNVNVNLVSTNIINNGLIINHSTEVNNYHLSGVDFEKAFSYDYEAAMSFNVTDYHLRAHSSTSSSGLTVKVIKKDKTDTTIQEYTGNTYITCTYSVSLSSASITTNGSTGLQTGTIVVKVKNCSYTNITLTKEQNLWLEVSLATGIYYDSAGNYVNSTYAGTKLLSLKLDNSADVPYLVNNNTSSSIEVSTATNYYMYETGDTLKVKLVFDYGFIKQYGYAPSSGPTVKIRIGSSSTIYTLVYKSILYGSIVNDDDYSSYQVALTYEMSQTITSSMKGMVIIDSISCSETLVDIAGNVINFDGALESEATNIKVNMAVAKVVGAGTAFESLTSALASITSSIEKEIDMIANTSECVTIVANRNITLDLNGKSISCTGASAAAVTVLGSLIIKDSSSGGKINSSGASGYGIHVKSAGTLTMQSGTIEASGASSYGILIANDSGTKIVTISGGTIGGNDYGIANKGGVLNFEGGTINKGFTGILLENNYTVNMTGGTITYSSGGYAIYGAGTIKVINSTLNGYTYGVRLTSGTVTITNSTIISDYYGVYITGGAVTVTTGDITGGTGGVFMNGGTLTLGVTGGDVSKETPLITGNTYGIIKNSGSVTLYDGMFRGKTSACYSGSSVVDCSTLINVIETGDDYFIKNDTVDGYKRAYLAIIRARACGIYHDSIQSAIDCATDGVNETVVMLRDTTESPTVPSGKIITLDLNGFTVTNESNAEYTIKNEGTLTVITSAANGKLTNNTINCDTIYNYAGILSIENSTNGSVTYSPIIENTKQNGSAISIYYGQVVIYGGIIRDVSSVSGKAIEISRGTLEINGGTISSNNIGIENSIIVTPSRNSSTVTVNGGSVTGSNYGIKNAWTLFVKAGTISGNVGVQNLAKEISNAGSFLCDGIMSVEGGTISGTAVGIQNDGQLTVSGGNISSIENSAYDSYFANTENIVEGDKLTITQGTITKLLVNDGTALISGGTIGSSSTTDTVKVTGGTLTVTGGTISSSNYGIHNTSGTIVLGVSDGVVSKTTPVILSRGIGIYSETFALKFYDGIVKAITSVCGNASGSVDCTSIIPLKTDSEMTELEKIDAGKGIPIYSVEAGYYVKSGTEGAYKTAFLSMAVAYACNKYFDSVQEAIDCAKNESLAGLSYSPNEFKVEPMINIYSIIKKIEYVSMITDNKNLKGVVL